MNSPKNLAIVAFALAAVGVSALAWKQHLELVALRASAMNADERADLLKRLSDAEKRAKELADELAALRSQQAGSDDEMAADDSGNQTNQNRRGQNGGRRGQNGGPGGRFGNMATLLENPAMQKLMAIQQKGQLDNRYAQLFKSLNLSPEQLDKFKNLLVERQTAMQDVFAAARTEGINPRDNRDAFQKMIADTESQNDASIKTLLGDDGYAKYQAYQATAPQRNTVSQLQQSLSYTNTPLSDTQADQLTQILAQTSPRNNRGGGQVAAEGNVTAEAGTPQPQDNRGGGGNNFGRGGGGQAFGLNFGGGGGGGTAQVTDQTITLAQGVLSAPQVQALQQLQQQQQAQQQLQQSIRQSLDAQRANNNGTGGTNGGRTTNGSTGTGGTNTTASTNRRG